MAKIECYTPEGKLEMKEPVDAKEAVEHCGYTMEAPSIEKSVVDTEATQVESIVKPTESKRGRKKKDK